MAKQQSKKRTPKDINKLAAFIVEQTTKESERSELSTSSQNKSNSTQKK